MLYVLHEINNADKHRLIQVAGAKVAKIEFTLTVGDIAVGLPRARLTMIEDGTKVMEAPLNVNVNVKPELTPYIAFWKGCRAARGLPVDPTLTRIAQHVSEIVEAFDLELS